MAKVICPEPGVQLTVGSIPFGPTAAAVPQTPQTRVKCERCGFDGWHAEGMQHVCMVFIALAEYERLKEAERQLQRHSGPHGK